LGQNLGVTARESAFDTTTTPVGSGLQNMADRLAALGGGVDVESRTGVGTRITGRVPVANV
jgi:signal transduction histidine kinase